MEPTLLSVEMTIHATRKKCVCAQSASFLQCLSSVYLLCLRPCSHSQFYPTCEPFANGTRRVAHVHTASGSSGTLRPHQEVFAVDANGTHRLALQQECSGGRVGYGSDMPSAHICRLTYISIHCNAANRTCRNHDTVG